MSKIKVRVQKLHNAGYNTDKHFQVIAPVGTTVEISTDDGSDFQHSVNVAADMIRESGYVDNPRLYRRFVMAQMFRMLNYEGYYGNGYTAYMHYRYGYDYTLTMLRDEMKVLARMQAQNDPGFSMRQRFFSIDVCIKTLEHHKKMLRKYIENLPERKCKGVPYKRIFGVNIFVADIDKKILRPVQNIISAIQAVRYTDHKYLSAFKKLDDYLTANRKMKLPYNTPKCPQWIDAFKANGAYYTMQNMIMFHGCRLKDANGFGVKLSMSVLDYYAKSKTGWQLLGVLKEFIEYNNFDFDQRMKEIYSK